MFFDDAGLYSSWICLLLTSFPTLTTSLLPNTTTGTLSFTALWTSSINVLLSCPSNWCWSPWRKLSAHARSQRAFTMLTMPTTTASSSWSLSDMSKVSGWRSASLLLLYTGALDTYAVSALLLFWVCSGLVWKTADKNKKQQNLVT